MIGEKRDGSSFLTAMRNGHNKKREANFGSVEYIAGISGPLTGWGYNSREKHRTQRCEEEVLLQTIDIECSTRPEKIGTQWKEVWDRNWTQLDKSNF